MGDLAEAISDEFRISVLVADQLSDRKVSGRLVAADAGTALDGLAFLCGTQWRWNDDRTVAFVGGEQADILEGLPNPGLTVEAAQSIGKEVRAVVGGQVVVEGSEGRLRALSDMFSGLQRRASAQFDLYVLDVSEVGFERVNAWLSKFNLSLGYQAAAEFLSQGVGAGAGEIVRRTFGGNVHGVDVEASLSLLLDRKTGKVTLRQSCELLSGGTVRFEAGQVLEDVVYRRQEFSGDDLVTAIERRVVGLTVDLEGVSLGDRWFLRVDLQDSGFVGGQEVTARFTGERYVRMLPGVPELVASFSRRVSERTSWKVPVLGDIPGVGKIFRKGEGTDRRRTYVVMIVGKGISDDE